MFSLFSKPSGVMVDEAFEALKEQGTVLVDVREGNEFSSGHAKGAISSPLSGLNATTVEKFKDAKSVYVICQSGGRSARATDLLKKFQINAINVNGGTTAWRAAMLPMQ